MSRGTEPLAALPTTMTPPEVLAAEHALRDHTRDAVERTAFKGTRRSRQFLEHLVEKALTGQLDDLKERSLGVEIFGRAPTYDTGEDANYRIDLPTGSYLPEFRRLTPATLAAPAAVIPAPKFPERAPPGRRHWWLIASVIATIALGIWLLHRAVPAVHKVLPWPALLTGFDIPLADYANRRYWPEDGAISPEMLRVLRLCRGRRATANPPGPARRFEIVLRVRTMAGSPSTVDVQSARPL